MYTTTENECLQPFFDCNVTLGKVKPPMPGGVLDAPKLLAEMDRYGIAESLVYHAMARRNSPARGNALAAEACTASERLHPCWMLLPPHTDELPPLDRLAEDMRAANVRAVRMAPEAGAHQYSLAPVVCGELFAWIERHRYLLLIEQSSITWENVDAILQRHPDLRLVMLNVTYRINRDLYPRLKAYRHLYVETSGLEQHCGIQDVCERFGPGRLIFGSRMPFFCAGASRHAIDAAGIPADAKTAIGGGNLRRLLSETI
ncbi:MAG TPA: amidohydrolase family protein [Candidatus Hydrogenedentes bacterium]|nr:amidohydrolase family protein [Candidatus Hydrogenedentota bacterium]